MKRFFDARSGRLVYVTWLLHKILPPLPLFLFEKLQRWEVLRTPGRLEAA